MKHVLWPVLATLVLATCAQASDHPCAADARNRSMGLLKLHFLVDAGDDAGDFAALANRPIENHSIDEKVEVRPPVKALVGPGKFDVLETTGYIYKATYRMRMIYAQIPGSCVLMGQEILEHANPY